MKRFHALSLALILGLIPLTQAQTVDSSLSFFITSDSIGQGGNLGGLSGADAHCQQLAAAVNKGNRVWRAYLSTQGANAVNARDRIGTGPWFNANKVKIASNLTELHNPSTNMISQTNGLTEKGTQIPASPNRHDILTGTRANGTAYLANADSTCANWTSSAAAPARAMLGHFNRHGVAGNIDSTSWVEAHISNGCTQANLVATGGSGHFYCFAADNPTDLRFRNLPSRVGRASDHTPYILGAGPRQNQIVYRFVLKQEGKVEVSVFDLEGHKRAVLMTGTRKAGNQEVRWDGTDSKGSALPAGTYFIVLKRDGQISR
jgi:hypothetical protein